MCITIIWSEFFFLSFLSSFDFILFYYYIFHNFLIYFRLHSSIFYWALTFHLDHLTCARFFCACGENLFFSDFLVAYSFLSCMHASRRDKYMCWTAYARIAYFSLLHERRHIKPHLVTERMKERKREWDSKHSNPNKEHSHYKIHISFKFSGMSFRMYAMHSFFSSLRFIFVSFDVHFVYVWFLNEKSIHTLKIKKRKIKIHKEILIVWIISFKRAFFHKIVTSNYIIILAYTQLESNFAGK